MSKQIDERVVEMRFDNAQFEKNVSTTMSTLEKLKRSLNLTGAAKGLEDIGAAAKKIDMGVMANGVEAVSVKFKALDSIVDQVYRNITNKVVNAAERLAKSLTTEPIGAGFKEYELKMGSVQTIMASTGESLATVNRYLNELNEYSDQTIYSFSDMTQNIGKFTNAGVKLEDAVMAIKGISNEAAVSGANANEASRAMYNFAQALSAGYVKLIDWKSIENANMATVEFKNQLIEAAVQAKTLEKTADGMYKVLTTNTQGSNFDQVIDATHYFNDSLNYQWMTTEVLVSTLKNYADETTDIGKKAKAAATEIKTFTMMMDTLKEAAQSGWAATWEIMFGDFEQAKNLWTMLGTAVGDVINNMSDSRNKLLRGAFQNSGWNKLTDEITAAGVSAQTFEDSLRNVLKSHGEDVDKLIKKHGSLERVFRNEAWGSEYLKEALSNINSELVDLSKITGTFKKGSTGDDVKKIQQALKNAGHQCGEFGEALDGVDGKLGQVTTEAIKAFQKAEGLKVDGIVGPETLKALEKYNKETKIFGKNIDELADSIKQLGGRELLIEGLKNIFAALKDILGAVKKAWDNVFDGIKSSDIFTLIERFHKFTTELKVNEKVASNITSTFEGLFSVLKFVKDAFVAIVSTGGKVIWNVFKPLAKIALSAGSAVGKFLKSAADTLSKFFDPLSDVAGDIGEMVGNALEKLSELNFIEEVGGWFSSAATKISEAVGKIQSYIDGLEITNKFENFISKFEGIKSPVASISKWWSEFEADERVQFIATSFMTPFKSLWETITSFKLPKFTFDGFLNSLTKLFQYLQNNNYTGIIGSFVGTLKYLKYTFIDAKWMRFEQSVITKFTEFMLEYGDDINAGFKKAKEIFTAITQFIFGADSFNLQDILKVAEKLVTILLLMETLDIVKNISGSLDSIADAFEGIGKGIKWRAIGAAFLSIGVALGAFVLCMKIIEDMKPEDAWRSAKILLLAIGSMALVVGGLVLLSNKMGSVKVVSAVGAMLMIAATLALLVYALKQIDGHEFGNLKQSFSVLIGVMGSLALVMAVIGKTCGGANFKSAAALLVFLTGLKMVLDVITAYSEYPWKTINNYTLVNMAIMLLGLAAVMRLATGGIKSGASISGMGFAILAMVLSLKILLGVISELGKMPVEQADRGINALWSIMSAITVFIATMNLTSKGTILEKGQRNVNGFVGLAGALLAIAATIAVLGYLPTNVLIKGGIATVTILGVLTGMLSILGKSMVGITGFGTVTTMLTGITFIIAELAAVMYLLKKWEIDGATALKQLGSIALVLAAMAGCLYAMSKLPIIPGNITTWIGAMAGMTLIVAGVGAVLKLLQTWQVDGPMAVDQFGAIALLLGAMTACLVIMSKCPIQAVNVTPWIGAMAGLVIVIAGLTVVLGVLKDWEVDGANAVLQFTAIGAMLLAMAGCIKILSFIGPAASGALPALGTLAIFAVGLIAFLDILGHIEQWTDGGFSKRMSSLVNILTDIGRAIGGLVGGVFEGIGKGLTAALPQMGKDLSDFMTHAGDFFSGLGSINADVISNAKSMVAVITEFVKAAGDNGWDNIWASGRSLPNLGEDLGNFMTNAASFFGGIAAIDANAATSAKSMAEAIGIIAEAASASTGMFNNGFENLGDKLKPFGEAMVDFSRTISGKIDTAAVEAAKSAADMMLGLKLPEKTDTLNAWLFGTTVDYETFGNQLAGFGQAMVRFSSVVSGGSINKTAIENAKNAAALMTELKLPAKNDTLNAWFFGTNVTYDDFGAQLVGFGQAMVAFSSVVSAEGAVNKTAIENAKNAAAIMSELKMPEKNDTFKAWWSGSTISFDEFGTQLVMFGRAMVMFSSVVSAEGAINKSAIENAKSAAGIMLALEESLPETTSWFDRWFGDGGKMTIKDFGKQLVNFGEAIVDFSEAVSGGLDESSVISAVTVATDVLNIMKNLPDDFDMSIMKTALKDLGEAMVAFSSDVSGNVDNEAVLSVSSAAKTIAQAASIMPDEVNLAKLTVGLDEFGNAIVSFSEVVSGKIDDGSIAAATRAGTDIATMMSVIPQNLADPTLFIDNLGKLGKAIVDFTNSISASDGSASLINQDVLIEARTACEQIGSMLLSLSGFTDITYFIDNAKSLATALVDFSNTVGNSGGRSGGGINTDAITNAATAGTQIGEMMKSFIGFSNVDIAIGCIKQLAQAIVDFNNTITMNTVNPADLWTNANYAKQAGDLIITLLKSASEVYDIGPFINGMKSLGTGLVDFSKTVSAEGAVNKEAISNAYSSAVYIRNALTLLDDLPDIATTISLLGDLGQAMVDFSNMVADLSVNELSINSEAFKNVIKSFGELPKSGIDAFMDNLERAGGNAEAAVSSFCLSMVVTILTFKQFFTSAGKNLVQGFADGITNNASLAINAASAMASAALSAAKAALGINSPSKEFYDAGAYSVDGFVNALNDRNGVAVTAGSDLAASALAGLQSAIATAKKIIENGVDAELTIRPVLDMSDIEAKVPQLANLFAMSPSVGVMANVGAISRGMGGIQNGGNADIIHELSNLSKKLDNVGGDTYNINGVSYNDDSDLADAVQTIVRYATIERRV